MRVKREDIKWALVEDGGFFNDDEGVILYETRKEARMYRNSWARFLRGHSIDKRPPVVVKVRVLVEVVRVHGKPEEPLDE